MPDTSLSLISATATKTTMKKLTSLVNHHWALALNAQVQFMSMA
jgi:hypothetical protein